MEGAWRRARANRLGPVPPRILSPLVVVMATVALLAGCVPESTAPEPEVSSPVPSESAAPPPEFLPEGTAEENKPFFDAVNRGVIDDVDDPSAEDFARALVEAGFAKKTVELTADRTSVDLEADSVQFSVRIDGDCLIGQYGNVGYASIVAERLATKRCLVGQTAPVEF